MLGATFLTHTVSDVSIILLSLGFTVILRLIRRLYKLNEIANAVYRDGNGTTLSSLGYKCGRPSAGDSTGSTKS